MLVLSRKNGECINIGGDIEVKVLDVRGGRVRLGFSAPPDVNIQRQEISRAFAGRFESWETCDAVEELCAQVDEARQSRSNRAWKNRRYFGS